MTARGRMVAGPSAAAMMLLAGVAGAQGTTPDDQGGLMPGGVPPADQPLIRRVPEPKIAIEGGIGVLGYVGGAADAGPSWNVRLTARMTPRFGLEAAYTGSANQRANIDKTLVLTAVEGSARYNILRADEGVVQPFVTAGLGYAGWAGDGGDPFSLTIPLSVGVERMVTRNIKVGARFNLRPALFDDLSVAGGNEVGGDTWALMAQGGGAF